MPRTTLSLEDEVLGLLKRYARARSMSLGDAVGDLVRRGLEAPPAAREVNGLYVLELPAGSPRVTEAVVKRLDADEP